MDCNTGHLVNGATLAAMSKAAQEAYTEIPDSLNQAANRKLAGRNEAMVSLKSGGKLSGFAAMTRNQRRNARKKLGY
jgi:ABC-type enterochelin transport system substrate-binding protein